MDWTTLQKKNPITTSVIDEWCKLIGKESKEHDYHEYIKNHAGMFLIDGSDSFFAISKLKLGSEYETDFAIPYENHSMGLYWELIEIKTPSAAPYNANGMPSAKLVQAIQQVQDWKCWLRQNTRIASKLFQARGIRLTREPNFKFTIIIGTRENSEKYLNKRNDYADSLNIQIRSFDYLTSKLQRRAYWDSVFLSNGDWDEKHIEERKMLANPFYRAFTDSEWKKLLSEPDTSYPHFTSRSHKYLLKHLTLNHKLFQKFELWYKKPNKKIQRTV